MSDQILLGEFIHRQNSINKPAACIACKRKKIRCNKSNEGCDNCSKSSLQCVYPAPEVGAKRKRGPYKKDKTPRERHLEDLVKYLKPEKSENDTGSSDQGSPQNELTPGLSSLSRSTSAPSAAQASNSESLVTDALIALTRSSVADQCAQDDSGQSLLHKYVSSGVHGAAASQHPPVRRIFEYWHLFVARVDPMVKVIHCPTFAKKLFGVIDNIGNVSPSTNALLFSIYYTALGSCTAREARQRFGESREELMQRFGRHFESAVGHSFDVPSLESLQSLILYMIALPQIPNHRHGGGSIKHMFTLAIRSAQMMRLHEDPGLSFSPFEAELRRRLWYHLCGLESRSAEESSSRQPSFLHNHAVRMPSNLNDWDIAPGMSQAPHARNGITETTFPILRFEIHSLIFGLLEIKKKWATFEPSETTNRMREEQIEWLERTQRRLENEYMEHLDISRPHDWMCNQFVGCMLIKARLMVDFPSGTVPSKTMSLRERMHLLQASVEIIQLSHLLATDDRISDCLWYFRGYIQWHCIAVVVAELGWNANQSFSNSAWAVLDPILGDWDIVYKSKRDDPAWHHVNTIIERARSLRLQNRAHTARRIPAEKARSSVDVLLGRATSTGTSTMSPYQNRSTVTDTPGGQNQMTPTIECHDLPRETWSLQQPEPLQFEQTPVSQYQTVGYQGADTYAPVGAMGSFGIDSSGFDEIDFAAFNEVFNSQSWNHFDPMEISKSQRYEPAPYTA